MKPNLVRIALWNSLEELENACSNFESNVQFTGGCFSIYSSLVTLYFAEMHLLCGGQMKKTKEEFIRKITMDHSEAALQSSKPRNVKTALNDAHRKMYSVIVLTNPVTFSITGRVSLFDRYRLCIR